MTAPDVTVLFPARMRITQPDGTLTTEALRAFASLVQVLGGNNGVLPNELTFALADGSADQPSLNFVSDPNTGIYRSGSDTLAISSGGQFAASVGPKGLTLRGFADNAFIYNGEDGALASTAAAANGQLLIGRTGEEPRLGQLVGSPDQVLVHYDHDTGNIDLGLPQPIQITSSPTFADLTLTDLTPFSFMFVGAASLLSSTAQATNGQLLIGVAGADPVAATLTGTANQVLITNGAGTITLATPQDIATTSSPTFANLTDTGLTVHGMLYTTTANLIKSTAAPTNGQLLIGANSADPALATLTGTANQVTVTNAASSITLSLPQDIATTSSPTFANITDNGLTAQGMLYANSSKVITSTAAPTNGQLLIGATSAAPALSTLTGTANQVIVTNAAHSITLSLPQDIGTGSSPTFASISVGSISITGATAKAFVYSDASAHIVTTAAPTNGQLLIGSTGNIPAVAALTGTANQVTVTNGAGTITLSTPQDIATTSSPSFAGLRINTIAAASFLYANSSGTVNSLALTINGALLIGATTGSPVATTLTGTSNQVTVTNGTGSITLSTPQDIATTSSPTFANITDSGLTAQGMLYANSSKVITSTGAPTNGQLLVGATSAAPALATLTGTANQVTVTNAANSITLSLPQSIATTSDVIFNSVTVAAGSNTSTSLRFAAGNGIYSPGTNQLAIATASTFALVVDASQNVGIGTTSPSSALHVSGSLAIIRFDRYATGNGNGAAFIGRRANGTQASPSATQSGDDIAAFVARGYGTTGFVGAGVVLKGLAAENFTDSVGGMHMVFQTTPTGTLTLTEGMRLTQAQNLLIGTTTDDGSNKLQIAGNLAFIGTGRRLVGDMSTSTVDDRFALQTSTSNGQTIVEVIPNGTATLAAINLRAANSNTNGTRLTLLNTGTTTQIRSDKDGTATVIPLAFFVGSEIARFTTDPNFLVNRTTNTTGAEKVQINGSLSISSATMLTTYTAFTNGAAANTGTLTNAPAAGNPTKWIPINDNGTTRYIPAW